MIYAGVDEYEDGCKDRQIDRYIADESERDMLGIIELECLNRIPYITKGVGSVLRRTQGLQWGGGLLGVCPLPRMTKGRAINKKIIN